jgi:methylated-DNA-[protein]-cysteine S-methyltransferase
MVCAAMIESPIGLLRAEADENAVTMLQFDGVPTTAAVSNPVLDKLRAELSEYFAGRRNEFTVAVNPAGTHFQQRVWSELLRIPFGKTISYHELAVRIGKPTSDRAVAQANGANPICILIPCHRVIGKDGRLTGYSAGLERKRFLLGLEQGEAIDTKKFSLEVQECSY